MATEIERFSEALREHAEDFGVQFNADHIERLSRYYGLLIKWNPRLHLIAPCPPEEVAVRHVLESLVLLPHLSQAARVTDVGSGAGPPILPCLILRRDLRATLLESSQKKAVFLREALRQITVPGQPAGPPPRVIATRFEETPSPPADFVTCRALDHFQEALPALIEWSPPESTLLFFGGPRLRERMAGLLAPVDVELVPQSSQRFLIIARKKIAA